MNKIYLVFLRYDYDGDELAGLFTSHQLAKDFIDSMWHGYKDKAIIVIPDINPDINSTRYAP
jgi:hypothetical protein